MRPRLISHAAGTTASPNKQWKRTRVQPAERSRKDASNNYPLRANQSINRFLVVASPQRRSVYAWHDAPGHQGLVLLPCCPVLGGALVLVPHLAVDEQDGEVEGVEVRHGRDEACSSALDGKGGGEIGQWTELRAQILC